MRALIVVALLIVATTAQVGLPEIKLPPLPNLDEGNREDLLKSLTNSNSTETEEHQKLITIYNALINSCPVDQTTTINDASVSVSTLACALIRALTERLKQFDQTFQEKWKEFLTLAQAELDAKAALATATLGGVSTVIDEKKALLKNATDELNEYTDSIKQWKATVQQWKEEAQRNYEELKNKFMKRAKEIKKTIQQFREDLDDKKEDYEKNIQYLKDLHANITKIVQTKFENLEDKVKLTVVLTFEGKVEELKQYLHVLKVFFANTLGVDEENVNVDDPTVVDTPSNDTDVTKRALSDVLTLNFGVTVQQNSNPEADDLKQGSDAEVQLTDEEIEKIKTDVANAVKSLNVSVVKTWSDSQIADELEDSQKELEDVEEELSKSNDTEYEDRLEKRKEDLSKLFNLFAVLGNGTGTDAQSAALQSYALALASARADLAAYAVVLKKAALQAKKEFLQNKIQLIQYLQKFKNGTIPEDEFKTRVETTVENFLVVFLGSSATFELKGKKIAIEIQRVYLSYAAALAEYNDKVKKFRDNIFQNAEEARQQWIKNAKAKFDDFKERFKYSDLGKNASVVTYKTKADGTLEFTIEITKKVNIAGFKLDVQKHITILISSQAGVKTDDVTVTVADTNQKRQAGNYVVASVSIGDGQSSPAMHLQPLMGLISLMLFVLLQFF